MIKAILFDLDGTLVNSLEDLGQATNFSLKKYGYSERSIDEFKMFVGDGIVKMIERALGKSKVSAEKFKLIKESFLEYYNTHYCDKTCFYEGMPELIDSLNKAGMKLAVVTNKVEFMAKIIVNKLFGNSFDVVYGQRDDVPTKPDPTLTLMAMKDLDVVPEECVFLGDSGVDIKTAVNSGALPVGALWGFRGKDELAANGAKFFINKPHELLKIINND